MRAKPTKHRGEILLQVNRRDEGLLAAASEQTTPFKIKQILVPIDFSACAKKALRYALPLAKQHGAALTLLYVLPTPAYAMGEFGGLPPASLEAELRAGSVKQLAALAEDEVHGEVPVETFVRTGMPAAEIMAVAKKLPADLIVISTHGHTGLTHVFMGSVAERIVQRASCPVLVVREAEREILS